MEKKEGNRVLKIRSDEELETLFNEKFALSNLKTRKEFLKLLLSQDKTSGNNSPNFAFGKDEKRISWLSTRITATDKSTIYDQFGKSKEKQLGRFLANCVSGSPIQVQTILQANANVLPELKKIGVNLNQVAIRANQLGGVDEIVRKQLNDIHELLIKLSTKDDTQS